VVCIEVNLLATCKPHSLDHEMDDGFKLERPLFFFEYPVHENGSPRKLWGHWSEDPEDYAVRSELHDATFEEWGTGYRYTQTFKEAQTEFKSSVSLSQSVLNKTHIPTLVLSTLILGGLPEMNGASSES